MNLKAACKFNLAVNTKLFENFNVLFVKNMWKSFWCRLKIVKSALFCFFNPRIIITVSVENNSLVFFDCLKDEVMQVLNSVGMGANAGETAALLSYGDQRRLEIAITLAMEPL